MRDTPQHSATLGGSLLLSIPEAAHLLGIHRSSVYRLIDAGELPIVQFLGVRKVARIDVDSFIAKRRRCVPTDGVSSVA